MSEFRIESDSMGELQVPADAYYGAQTQRAVNNFAISGLRMPRHFIRALGLLKSAAASANMELGLLDQETAAAIIDAGKDVACGALDAHFPVDVFQTGSGTSSNMNANEVIASIATLALERPVHPNDEINQSQSSNDVIPSAIQVAARIRCEELLIPALHHLKQTIDNKAELLGDVVKTGRTHLMDAMPVTFRQELKGWAGQIESGIERVETGSQRLRRLPIGGTAVGTGVNAHPEFAGILCRALQQETGLKFEPHGNPFVGISSQDSAVELSGHLKTLAVSLTKIANDLRWMNSGPLAGLAEISLPALQPGSSMMPGKVNPVIPEAVAMVCAQVIGNDLTITLGGQAGNFQLNVMLPVIAHNLLQSIEMLGNACNCLADSAIAGFTVNHAQISRSVERNPILVTALNSVIGYDRGAQIAKRAYREGRSVREVAREDSGLDDAQLDQLLDPLSLTRGG